MLAVAPMWIFNFANPASYMELSHKNQFSLWRISRRRGREKRSVSDKTQIALTIVVALGWERGRRDAAGQNSGIQDDPQRVVIDEVSGQHLTLLLGCAVPIWWREFQTMARSRPTWPRHLAFGAQLEIFVAGFYTFSVVRHLEAVSSAAGRIAARRLGNHGGRTGWQACTRESVCGWRVRRGCGNAEFAARRGDRRIKRTRNFSECRRN